MFGLDEHLAALGTGEAFLAVSVVAVLLGLRHATDPDHLTAVSTLIASSEERSGREAGRLGFAWGLGHATTLFVFGLPIVLFNAFLPHGVVQGAEVAIGLLIMALALRLLLRWRRGELSPGHADVRRVRSPLQAYGVGLLHGLGGSAGIGVLLLAAIPDELTAAAALLLFALFSAISMALASTTFGYTLTRGPFLTRYMSVAPALAAVALAFGAWYSLGAIEAVPYYF